MLRKNSYINIKNHHTLPLDVLRDYDGGDTTTRYVLTRESYRELINYAWFATPVLRLDGPSSTLPSTTEAPANPLSIADQSRSYQPSPPQRADSTPRTLPLPSHGNPPQPHTYGTITPRPPRVPMTSAQDRLRFARVSGPTSRQSDPLLPRHNTARPPRATSAGGGHGGVSGWDRLWALMGQAMCAVRPYTIRLLRYGAVGLSLWLLWVYRAAIGQWLLRALAWGARQVWNLLKGIGGGVVRGVAWVVGEVVRRVKEVVGVEGRLGLE